MAQVKEARASVRTDEVGTIQRRPTRGSSDAWPAVVTSQAKPAARGAWASVRHASARARHGTRAIRQRLRRDDLFGGRQLGPSPDRRRPTCIHRNATKRGNGGNTGIATELLDRTESTRLVSHAGRSSGAMSARPPPRRRRRRRQVCCNAHRARSSPTASVDGGGSAPGQPGRRVLWRASSGRVRRGLEGPASAGMFGRGNALEGLGACLEVLASAQRARCGEVWQHIGAASSQTSSTRAFGCEWPPGLPGGGVSSPWLTNHLVCVERPCQRWQHRRRSRRKRIRPRYATAWPGKPPRVSLNASERA